MWTSTAASCPVIRDILAIVKRHDMVVATGHVSISEAVALTQAAREMGISKIVATHPLETRFRGDPRYWRAT